MTLVDTHADRLEDLLRASHYVSLHCYLDASTYHIINAETLAMMPRGSILVNTARGGCVDGEDRSDRRPAPRADACCAVRGRARRVCSGGLALQV